MEQLIRLRILGSFSTLQQVQNTLLGPQLISAEVVSVTSSAITGHVEVVLSETIPVPMNQAVISSTIVI